MSAGRVGWTGPQALKNALIVGAVRTLLGGLRLVPMGVLVPVGRALGVLAYAFAGELRRIALANLARALPDRAPAEHRALARRAFRTLGANLGEIAAVLTGRAPALPEVPASARATLAAANAEGRGVLFASAHLGPWESVAAALVAAGVPLVAVARESYDPRLTPLQDRLRAARAVPVVYRGAPGAGARMLRALRGGAVLGVPMDLRSRVPSIDAPFLGHPASTPVGPARLALRTGAAVVVGTIDPRGVVTATRIPTGDLTKGSAGEATLTARINHELGARILAYPEGWLWMHDRFHGVGPPDVTPS